MTVWWCEEHGANFDESDDRMCLKASFVDTDLNVGAPWQTPCRMVEKLLVDVAELPDADVGPLPGAVRRRLRGANGE